MTGRLEKQIDLKADVEDVFSFITSLDVMKLWPSNGKVPAIISSTGRFVQGETLRFQTSDGAEHEHYVSELVPKKSLRLQLKKVGFPIGLCVQEIVDRFEVETIQDGTRLKRVFEIKFRPNFIAEMLGRRLYVEQFSRALDRHHLALVEKFSK